jgi:CheY-like chemotaxis protein
MVNRPLEVLLIEDNQADADLIREAVAAHRMPVSFHIAKTGEEALQFLFRTGSFTKALRPDLILLDLNLPGMDGREVLERIKTDRNFRQIPVIVLTSAQADLDILRSYSMGASCYILKPVDPKTFCQVINLIQDFWGSIVQLPKYELVEKYGPLQGVQTSSLLPKANTEAPVHVLYVEDSDADSESVFEDLAQLSEPRFTSHRESRLEDSFRYLKTHAADVVLLDLFLPDSEGFETVLRFHANFPLLPLVVFTAREDQAQGIRAVKEGADDYLVKGQTQRELLGRTLLHAIERKSRSLFQLDLLSRERAARNEAEKAAGIRDEFLSIASH